MYEMALLSLHCGLRAGEVFSLTWKDVDLDHGLITLLDTKASKTRTVSITADVKKQPLRQKNRSAKGAWYSHPEMV